MCITAIVQPRLSSSPSPLPPSPFHPPTPLSPSLPPLLPSPFHPPLPPSLPPLPPSLPCQFDPDLVMVSCGLDAAKGDPLGNCSITPSGYAHMTHLLMGLAGGRIVVVLEVHEQNM